MFCAFQFKSLVFLPPTFLFKHFVFAALPLQLSVLPYLHQTPYHAEVYEEMTDGR